MFEVLKSLSHLKPNAPVVVVCIAEVVGIAVVVVVVFVFTLFSVSPTLELFPSEGLNSSCAKFSSRRTSSPFCNFFIMSESYMDNQNVCKIDG